MYFKNIGEEAKIFFKKVKSLPPDKFLERAFLGVRKAVSNYPKFITLQTVSACNLQCKHCFINDYRTEIEDGVIKIMKFQEFLRFSDRLKKIIQHAEFFTFSSFEALLNKNLFRMMDHLLSINPSLKFPLLSNAMLITDEIIRQLENYPVTEINISLDGMTKNTVEGFKTGVEFDKIIAAIKRLQNSKLKHVVAVTFVAHQDNIHELPAYVDYVNELGVKLIYVSNILTFTSNNAHLALYTPEGNASAQNLFDDAIKRAKKNGQTIQVPELKPQLKGCQAVEAFFIDSNGNIAPCDFLAVSTPFTLFGTTKRNPPTVFGNIFKEDPVDIYRSQTYQQFRKAHRLGKDLPEPCQNCIDAYGLMCSNRKVYK